jgi:DNA-binding NtrC family response regulator
MRKLFGLLDKVSGSDANVLIEGESGTGKELVASEIVRRGARARKPFVVVDCGSISSNLIESELFGHARGAFTGADKDRVGAFEAADGGTVFLDEIGEMPLDMQPKLLRALEAREVRRVGETKSRKVDVRVIAATNRRLDREVNQGRFREDLCFRLSVITVRVPALRERAGDMELLVNVFLDALGARASRHLFTPELLREMEQWEWPGNVRELRNHIERVVVLGTPMSPVPPPTSSDNLETAALGVDLETPFRDAKEALVADFERRYVTALMDWADGNVSRAARKAKMDRMNLHRLVQRYNLREPSPLKD